MRQRETVAEGIKRRIADKAKADRSRRQKAVKIAIWSSAVGFIVMMMAVASSGWNAGFR